MLVFKYLQLLKVANLELNSETSRMQTPARFEYHCATLRPHSYSGPLGAAF